MTTDPCTSCAPPCDFAAQPISCPPRVDALERNPISDSTVRALAQNPDLEELCARLDSRLATLQTEQSNAIAVARENLAAAFDDFVVKRRSAHEASKLARAQAHPAPSTLPEIFRPTYQQFLTRVSDEPWTTPHLSEPQFPIEPALLPESLFPRLPELVRWAEPTISWRLTPVEPETTTTTTTVEIETETGQVTPSSSTVAPAATTATAGDSDAIMVNLPPRPPLFPARLPDSFRVDAGAGRSTNEGPAAATTTTAGVGDPDEERTQADSEYDEAWASPDDEDAGVEEEEYDYMGDDSWDDELELEMERLESVPEDLLQVEILRCQVRASRVELLYLKKRKLRQQEDEEEARWRKGQEDEGEEEEEEDDDEDDDDVSDYLGDVDLDQLLAQPMPGLKLALVRAHRRLAELESRQLRKRNLELRQQLELVRQQEQEIRRREEEGQQQRRAAAAQLARTAHDDVTDATEERRIVLESWKPRKVVVAVEEAFSPLEKIE
ncbi:hypothetical protein JCM11491_002016 [Sporobolomyces phaffii]